jgi:hypothetical protein
MARLRGHGLKSVDRPVAEEETRPPGRKETEGRVRMNRLVVCAIAAGLLVFPAAAGASSLVTTGSPSGTTPQNHQNEPAVAVSPANPDVLAAGVNDFVDWRPCPETATQRGTCFDPGDDPVGLSGVYFSFNRGHTWTQPAYTGLTAADCASTGPCMAHTGAIHTLPWYAENGLISNGDPAVAFGPRPVNGVFSWANGARLYYANLTASLTDGFPQKEPFKGFLAVGVSRIDNPTATSVQNKNSWMPPVIATSRMSSTTFEDKEQIWADNAATSPFFGNVYMCVDEFRSNSHGPALPIPQVVAISRDGGDTWTKKQVNSATANVAQGFKAACSIRTDSHGVVYLFYTRFAIGFPGIGTHVMQKSLDGGQHWTPPVDTNPMNDACYNFDPVEGRCVGDGFSGVRIDLTASPSVDIANGAPSGVGATNEIVDAWSDGRFGLNSEVTLLSYSKDGGSTWSSPSTVSLAGDRSLYSAPAISPGGDRVYVVYEGPQTPWQGADFTTPRLYHGVFRSAPIGSSGAPGTWTTIENGPLGDLRATYPGHDIYQERIGDYVYAAATPTYGAAVWTDARDAGVCNAVQTWRAASFAAGHRVLPGAPWPLGAGVCPATFGNTNIYAATTG